MARRNRTPKGKPKVTQRLRENQKPAYGISVVIEEVTDESKKYHTFMHHEVYLDKAKVAWMKLAVREGRAEEAFGENAGLFKELPEGTELQVMNLTLVWDTWEGEEGSDD